MEHLKDTEKFIVYKEEEDLPTYVSKLVSWIERFIFNRISKRVNWVLDRQKDDSFEITKDGNTIGEEGNWRRRIDGDDFVTERHDGSDWITFDRIHGS